MEGAKGHRHHCRRCSGRSGTSACGSRQRRNGGRRAGHRQRQVPQNPCRIWCKCIRRWAWSCNLLLRIDGLDRRHVFEKIVIHQPADKMAGGKKQLMDKGCRGPGSIRDIDHETGQGQALSGAPAEGDAGQAALLRQCQHGPRGRQCRVGKKSQEGIPGPGQCLELPQGGVACGLPPACPRPGSGWRAAPAGRDRAGQGMPGRWRGHTGRHLLRPGQESCRRRQGSGPSAGPPAATGRPVL